MSIRTILKHSTKHESLKATYGTEKTSKTTRISFSSVDVKVFCLTIGDNPSVNRGVPVQIEWKAQSEHTGISFEEIEENKKKGPPLQRYPRVVHTLSSKKRHQILIEYGFHAKELRQAEKDVMTAKIRRLKTIQKLTRMSTEALIEELVDRIMCKKEIVLDYPGMSCAHSYSSVDQNNPLIVPCCRVCSVRSLENNGKVCKHAFHCCVKKHSRIASTILPAIELEDN